MRLRYEFFDLSARDDFSFLFPFRVRYSEVDGQSVVFNAHYLTYFDTAVTEYFRAAQIDLADDVKKSGCDFHVVKSLVEYKAPLKFDQTFEVGVRVAQIGRSSVAFVLGVFDCQTARLHATGEIVWVYTHQTTHETHAVPDAFRARIAAFQKL